MVRGTHLDGGPGARYARFVGTIQSLERGLRILDELAEADVDPMRRQRGVPLSVLAAQLDVHRTTALRLVQTLVALGYATTMEGRQGYRLGPAMRRDAVLSVSTQRLRRAARPFLEELVDRTGECAHAAVPDGDRALVIDDVETDRPLRVVPSPGRHVALHCTSAGKCLLAYGLADMPVSLPARTSRTITTREDLLTHLEMVRGQGYAFDDEENDPHTRCLSAPVFGPSGAAVGCIGIDAPSVRLTADHVPVAAAHVMDVAGRLSAALGMVRSA
ncbi:IclR family transcriptional regulator [soil metagenome]